MRTGIAAVGVVVLVVWFLLPYALDRSIVVERDALSSILPMRAVLARALQSGSWPTWNPEPVLGKPFLAEWQTGLFYPPSLLLAVPPFSRGFNAFFVFHYVSTALGAFLFARAAGATRAAAALGSVAWTLGGPLVSLGHLLNHLVAVSWLPWVLWAWTAPRRPRVRITASSVFLALCLLTGSPEMALLIAGLLVVWARDLRSLAVPPLAALLAAMQLVPVWAYLGITHRGVHGLESSAVLAYSTPLERLVGLFLAAPATPEAFLPTLYLGAIPFLLAAIALGFLGGLTRLTAILLALGLVALALGGNTFLLPVLHASIPGVGLLRYPEKLLVGLSALVAFGAAWGLTQVTARLPRPAAGALALALLAATVADLGRANRGVLLSLPPAEVLSTPPLAETALASGGRRYYSNTTGAPRVETPRAAIERDRTLLFAATGELYGLGNVNTPGSLNVIAHERLHRSLEQLLQPQALSVLRALGTGWATSFAPLRGPGVTEKARAGAGLYRLGDGAPRAFVAKRVRVAPGAEEALAAFVRADEPLGLAILEGVGVEDVGYQAPLGVAVDWTVERGDEIALAVQLATPGLLVVNDTYAPGWHATVDGEPTRIERVNGLVRGIWLDGGTHQVALRYRPPGLALGLALSLTTLVGLLAFAQREDPTRALRSHP